ncbi:MAG TPA: IclR family transcriptional regulator [Xanthobacteraceae bacterium]|nr:IclR family transcriptional regulator [Xanthobacteraceae bacterium]
MAKAAHIRPGAFELPSPSNDVASPAGRGDPARGAIQSVDRALVLLEALAAAGGETTLTSLSRTSGLNVSTCHHLLSTLAQRGYVAKRPGRTYALGARVLHLGHSFLKQVDLPQRARPVLDRINVTTGETVHLAVMQGDAIVNLLKFDARHALRVDAGGLGTSDAPHATAAGKAMLAWLPEEKIRRILALHGMAVFTPATLTDPDVLIEELRLVRRNGFAMDNEEFQPGVVCVGAAIRDYSGAVVGAISASAPAVRATESHLKLMREAVVAGARDLSAEFGELGADLPRGDDDEPLES